MSVCVKVNFISTGSIYEDFYLQTDDIWIAKCFFLICVGLVSCAMELLGRIGFALGLVFGWVSSVDII